jgi:hypothetical protein
MPLLSPARLTSTSAIEFQAVLGAEARRWLQMGQANGYFAGDIRWEIPEGEAVEQSGFFRDSPSPDTATFAAMLADAQEDLTRARIRFIELFVFADDGWWALSLKHVKDFAEALQHRGWLDVETVAVERIAWSLRGAEAAAEAVIAYTDPQSGQSRDCVSPAAWRIELPDPPRDGQFFSPRMVARLVELEETRAPIITTICSILTRVEQLGGQGSSGIQSPISHGSSLGAMVIGGGFGRRETEGFSVERPIEEIETEETGEEF